MRRSRRGGERRIRSTDQFEAGKGVHGVEFTLKAQDDIAGGFRVCHELATEYPAIAAHGEVDVLTVGTEKRGLVHAAFEARHRGMKGHFMTR